MDEKRTLGGFIKENKGKIIKWGIVVVSVIVGGVLIYKTVKTGTTISKDGLDILEGLENGLTEGIEVLGEAANIAG